jgi:hypothetical protein
MAELRRELTADVEEVGRSARAMADPGLYVRRFPWASVAVAVGVGYLLVPRKKEVIYPDPELLAKFIKQNRVRVETKAGEAAPKGFIKNLLMVGLTSGARMGMNYMMQRFASPTQPLVRSSEPAPSFEQSESIQR